ncbi:MAG: phosphoribosylglycinamide formyltransferase [Armatimonadota bacterium]|nr:phosphoribosylglycinamide formyltransferase [Armatimonadota bacterium]MDR7402277.1 phosphoribosylglycinamide formyltransferase [Armatimonadota bacterium]MDR7437635.1 phosphoribosylglycinamide formyltransferase [Armatimonadota bacterium]MDR7472601.1 phosphoribosylglycinamide formyltransferase [Armatimonadota bacterium]MDR7507498.1 phosphoribosylglycinamide formyltransferase [Armatimonadota bacterium]
MSEGPALPRPRLPLRLGVLVSGQGTNLQAILDACGGGEVPARVVVVVSSRPQAYALQRARAAGVPALALAPQDFPARRAYDACLAEILAAHGVDLVCLAGFVRLLGPEFVRRFAGRILNIHPSLLPAFGGPGMYGERVHEAVLRSGVKISGCTVHLVDETPDGGPIVLQAAVPVRDDDTVQTLAARVAAQEHRLYPLAIRLYALGRLALRGRRVIIQDPGTAVATTTVGTAVQDGGYP